MKQRRAFPWVETIVTLVAVAAIATVGYFQQLRESALTSSFDTRSSYDAASGGYRAWFELLQREGVRVERFEQRPAFLDGSVDVYILANETVGNAIVTSQVQEEPDIFGDGDWFALAKWVKAGGHLVWLSDGVASPDYLNAPEFIENGPARDDAVVVTPSSVAANVRSVSGTSKLRVPFDVEGAPPIIADDTGGVVATYPLGKGSVTLVSDQSLFENGRLALADNATLAFDLATAGLTEHGAVAFDEWTHGHVAGDSWWSVLPPPFQVAFVIIGLAIIALGVGTGLRFGPAVKLPDESERTSDEYLTSMAVLYRRGGAVKEAVVDMADSCLRDVASGLGLSEAASGRAIAARAGGHGGDERGEAVMELDRIRSFEAPTESELVHAAALCVTLRKELSPHARIGIGRRSTSPRRPS
ncbi:MAG TPA: DUF4350 domain-containing protein [Candidatus Eremiobacteraceae bacterium]|nr:DUF4350 domain-containing protein [Candidatus Eremiobacteraceae bacterium]